MYGKFLGENLHNVGLYLYAIPGLHVFYYPAVYFSNRRVHSLHLFLFYIRLILILLRSLGGWRDQRGEKEIVMPQLTCPTCFFLAFYPQIHVFCCPFSLVVRLLIPNRNCDLHFGYNAPVGRCFWRKKEAVSVLLFCRHFPVYEVTVLQSKESGGNHFLQKG